MTNANPGVSLGKPCSQCLWLSVTLCLAVGSAFAELIDAEPSEAYKYLQWDIYLHDVKNRIEKRLTNSRVEEWNPALSQEATESLELFYLIPNLRRQFNVAGNDGVVKVTADLPVIELPADDEEDIFTVNALLPPLTTEQKESGPVLTPVVFWSDIINGDAQGKLQFKFNHHDGRGKYRIRAYTHGSDGQLIIGEKDYEIK